MKGQGWGGTTRGTPSFTPPHFSSAHSHTHPQRLEYHILPLPAAPALTHSHADSSTRHVTIHIPYVKNITHSNTFPHIHMFICISLYQFRNMLPVSPLKSNYTTSLLLSQSFSRATPGFVDSFPLSHSVIGVAFGDQRLPSARINLLLLIKDKSGCSTLLVLYLPSLSLDQCLVLHVFVQQTCSRS